MSQVYRIENHYREAFRQLLGKKLSRDLSTLTSGKDKLREQVEKDLPRSVFFTRDPKLVGPKGDSAKPIKDLWRRGDTDFAYTQGNMDSRVFAEITMMMTGHRLEFKDAYHAQGDKTTVGFAFVDKNGLECGFSVTASVSKPGFFVVALGKNMRVGSPDEREMTVYVSSAGPDTPSLKDVIVEGYSDDNLQAQATMREELLGDDSLPDEVKALIRAMLTSEGTLDIDSAKEISEALKTNSVNNTVFFKQELEEAKQNLLVYRTFCQASIQNLVKVRDNAEVSKEDRDFAAALTKKFQEVNLQIKGALREIGKAVSTGTHTYASAQPLMSKYAKIQQKIFDVLKKTSANPLYQDTIDKMQARFDHASRSFGERRGTSTVIGGAFTVLGLAGAAIIAAGLLVNPIGLAIASAASVAVGAASLISWGVAAYKEFSLAQERGALGQALTDEVDKLIESGGQQEILGLVVDKMGQDDAPEASTKARTTFFKEAYRQATQKAEDTTSSEDRIEKVESDGPKGP